MVAERCIFVSISEAVTTPSSALHPPLDFTVAKWIKEALLICSYAKQMSWFRNPGPNLSALTPRVPWAFMGHLSTAKWLPTAHS